MAGLLARSCIKSSGRETSCYQLNPFAVITRTSSSSRTREASSRENLIFRRRRAPPPRRHPFSTADAVRKQRHFCSRSNSEVLKTESGQIAAPPPQWLHSFPAAPLSPRPSLIYRAALHDSFNNNPEMMSVFGICTARAERQTAGRAGGQVRCKGLSCRRRSRSLRDPHSPRW